MAKLRVNTSSVLFIFEWEGESVSGISKWKTLHLIYLRLILELHSLNRYVLQSHLMFPNFLSFGLGFIYLNNFRGE